MEPLPVEISEHGLPPDVADAWLNVLMDIWEKDDAKQVEQAARTPEAKPDKPLT